MKTKLQTVCLFICFILGLIEIAAASNNSTDSHKTCVIEGKEEGTQSVFINGKFSNPWPTWNDMKIGNFLKWSLFTKKNTDLPSDPRILDQDLPVHEITDEQIKQFSAANTTNIIKVIWIGHSTCLINMENVLILVDPIFSERASPFQSLGPKRYRPVPITIDRLPRVDAVLISHNHYDHLDYNSVVSLNKKFGTELKWFVGLKLKEWFEDLDITQNVHELDWWETKTYKNLNFLFTPAQHWSSRTGITDRNKSLWGGWSVIGSKKRLFYAGDTGYCSTFVEIGKKYGEFDLSLIPIGAYEPRFMMESQHVDPEQAVQIHMDVKSEFSIAVHWGTFALANEHYLEPKYKLRQAMKKFGLNMNSFVTIEHGAVFDVPYSKIQN